ncbi:MAG: hypothetical protein AB7K09_22450 [Planctomycetota bacterium]
MPDKPRRIASSPGTPDASGNDGDPKSNLGAKLVIVVFFLMAFGLGALATTIQLQNRAAQERIVSSTWPLDLGGSAWELDDQQIAPDNPLLTDWERAQIARRIAPHLNEYIRIKYTSGIENWDDQKAQPGTIVDRVGRECGIKMEGNVKFDTVREKRWTPWETNANSRALQGKYMETSFSFTFENIKRRDALAFALKIEDQYSFLTVREMDMSRKDDSQGGDAWKVRFTIVWYDRVKSGKTTS